MMPRSDKPISSGSLTDPVSSSRSRSWSSRAAGADNDHLEPDGLVVVDPLTHETVEDETVGDETVVNLMDAQAPTVVIRMPGPLLRRPEPTPVYGWTTVRAIEGRTYTRLDERHEVSETE